MGEQTESKSTVLVDKEAGERYLFVSETGKKIFAGSSLLDSRQTITEQDLNLIAEFHKAVSPANPNFPWRLTTQEGKSVEARDIVDYSTFANWEAPGGSLEHIRLASQAARIITERLKRNLKDASQVSEKWAKDAISEIKQLNPLHSAAAAALHDEGREVTHLFYTNELIGRRLLQRIGIRDDIRAVLPDETVVQVPLDESMDDYIRQMIPEAVIVRIADEFGKRKPGSNGLLQPEDFEPEFQEKWAQNFLYRPFSGRPSDKRARELISLHNANAQRYFRAMDSWVRAISNLTLSNLARVLNHELSPTLTPLNKEVVLTSEDLLDGETLTKEIRVGEVLLDLEALTFKGEPNKKFNEDACLAISDETHFQIFVVDGGTQIEHVSTLGELSGGKYIADKVVEGTSQLSPADSVADNLGSLNDFIGADEKTNHPEIIHAEQSTNSPYGSITGVKFDFENKTIEVANAGDVHVVSIDNSGNISFVTTDDVYQKYIRTLAKAKDVAQMNGVTVRKVMENINDPRFKQVRDEMVETMRQGNTGQIPRITGSPVFRVHTSSLPLPGVREIIIFTDGAIPIDVDVHTKEGLSEFEKITRAEGLVGLYFRVEKTAKEDPELERHPRFRLLDDGLILKLALRS